MADNDATVEYAEMLQSQRDDECAIACGEDLEGDLCRQAARCTKNPGHTGFSNILDFRVDSMEHLLPANVPKADFLQTVADHAARTVRLRVLSAPPQSPAPPASNGKVIRVIMQYGSGYLMNDFSDLTQLTPCPLETCPVSSSAHNVVGPLYILTADHIFKDNNLARNTEVDFFYDDQNDRSSIVVAYEHHRIARPVQLRLDLGIIQCFTHDLDFLNTIDMKKKQYCQLFANESVQPTSGVSPSQENFDVTDVNNGRISDSRSLAMCISHLHGMAKHVSVGTVKKENQLDWCKLSKSIGKAAREFGDDDTFYRQYNQNLESEDVAGKIDRVLQNESTIQRLVDSLTKETNETTYRNEHSNGPMVNETISSQITHNPVLSRAVTVPFWKDPAYKNTIKQVEKLFRSSKPNRTDALNDIKNPDKATDHAAVDASVSATSSTSTHSDNIPLHLEMSTSQHEKDKLNAKITSFLKGLITDVGRQAGFPTVNMSLLNKTEYTVPTCIGSSGARVLCLNTHQTKSTFAWHTHVATRTSNPGINLGGLAFSQKLQNTIGGTEEQSETPKDDTASPSNDFKDTKGFVTNIDLD